MIAFGLRTSVMVCYAMISSTVGFAAPAAPNSSEATVHIPLSVTHNARYGTYKASLSVGIGTMQPLSFGFDTGSTGLRVFADANVQASGEGVQCSQTPTSVTYGNPGRITYSGVVCYARLHFGDFSTPEPVPFAYLTSASCPKTNPHCKIPDIHNPRAMGGYGVFGAGLTGVMTGTGRVPNPFLTLPGRLGSTYSIRITRQGGEVILGSPEPENSVRFPLTPGTIPGEKWTLGPACLFVDRRAINDCTLISFDTGNGVPWIHNGDRQSIPQDNGIVKPGTQIGFAPPGDSIEGASLIAGSAFTDRIKVFQLPRGSPLINVSIQPFFDRTITYDYAGGAIFLDSATPTP